MNQDTKALGGVGTLQNMDTSFFTFHHIYCATISCTWIYRGGTTSGEYHHHHNPYLLDRRECSRPGGSLKDKKKKGEKWKRKTLDSRKRKEKVLFEWRGGSSRTD